MGTDFVAPQTTLVLEVNAEGNADGNLSALAKPAAWTAARQELDQHYFNLSEDARKDKQFWQERQDKINDQNSAIIAANRARDDAEAVVDDAFDAELEQQIASRDPNTRFDAFNEQQLAAVQDADEVLAMFSGRDPRDVDYMTILAQHMTNWLPRRVLHSTRGYCGSPVLRMGTAGYCRALLGTTGTVQYPQYCQDSSLAPNP
jgi:hypothetical protein